MTSITDSLNRVTQYDWCTCGALTKLIDPLGRVTSWQHDVESRQISNTCVDGSIGNLRFTTTQTAGSKNRSPMPKVRSASYSTYNRDDTPGQHHLFP